MGHLMGLVRKAVQPDPARRYGELSEYLFDLHHPNEAFLHRTRPPLVERSPVTFWKSVSLVLALIVVMLAMLLNR